MKVWLPTAWKGAIYEVCPIDANSYINKVDVCWCMN
jgi:cytochrome c oxidase assembly protein Cox11